MDMLICDLPYQIKKKLCILFDRNANWRLLAHLLNISDAQLKELYSEKNVNESFTSLILDEWSTENHLVSELFYKLLECDLKNSNKVFDEAISVLAPLFDSSLEALLIRIKDVSITSDSCTDIDRDTAVTSSYFVQNDCDFNELQIATMNWDKSCILGSGGFGIVYKGYWKSIWVAIKKFNSNRSFDQLLNELEILNMFKHDNILPLYSFSVNGESPCLVYQMMSGGSLDNALKNRNSKRFHWKNRLKIINGICRGLHYLHTFRKNQPLIHGDIKPANILLDDLYMAKIGDFGLSILANDHSTFLDKLWGTKPYLPADFLANGQLTTKVDVFSFGIMLIEILTEFKSYDNRWSHNFLKNNLEELKSIDTLCLIDPQLIADLFLTDFQNSISWAYKATASKPNQRPDMIVLLNHFETLVKDT